MSRPSPKQWAKIFRYDELSGRLWWRERGLGRRFSKPVGSITPPKGYIHVEYKGVAYKAHHIIWAIKTGRWPRHQIDHKDTIGSNNRFFNLREATHMQQCVNKKCYKSNSLGLKGVQLIRSRYRAVVTVNKKKQHLGYFATAQEAHDAYAKAAKKHFGEFARAS
jgi:hypothetical protein